MSYRIAATTIAAQNKQRNGDAFVHEVAPKSSAVVAMVADGVGSCPFDWLASQTACERLAEITKGIAGFETEPAKQLDDVLHQIDRDIHATTGRGRGMKCAAAVVLWLPDTDRAWIANIGDTRIYRFVDPEFVQVSDDDSMAVVRRGPDGKPLLSGGAAVVQRGITNALGSGQAQVNVQPASLPAGGAFVLASDGFYECSQTFETEIIRALCHENLEDALTALAEEYRGSNRDDATALLLRRAYPALSDPQLDEALARAACHPRHAVIEAIAERLPHLVANQDIDRLSTLLDYLDRQNIVLSREKVDALLEQMSALNWTDRPSHQALIAMIRR